jgi:hypothetical protein
MSRFTNQGGCQSRGFQVVAVPVLLLLSALQCPIKAAATNPLDLPLRPPPTKPDCSAPIPTIEFLKHEAGSICSVYVPFPCIGRVVTSTDPRIMFALGDESRIMRIDLNTNRTSLIDLGSTVSSTEYEVKRISADGRFAILRDGSFIDTHAKELSRTKLLPSAVSLHVRPGWYSEDLCNFIPYTNRFVLPIENHSREESWAVVDLESATLVQEITIPGRLGGFSADYRYAAFLDVSGDAVLRDLKENRSLALGSGFDDLAVTFRGTSAVAVGINHGPPVIHSFYQIDLTQFPHGVTGLGQFKQEVESRARWNWGFEPLPARVRDITPDRQSTSRETFVLIGKSLLAGATLGKIFDLHTGTWLPISHQVECNGGIFSASNSLFRVYFKPAQAFEGRLIPGEIIIQPFAHFLRRSLHSPPMQSHDQLKALIATPGIEALLRVVSILGTTHKDEALAILAEIKASEISRLRSSRPTPREVAAASASLGSQTARERNEAFGVLRRAFETCSGPERERLLEDIVTASTRGDQQAALLITTLKGRLRSPSVIERINALRDILADL